MAFCSSCGAQIPAGSTVCPNCSPGAAAGAGPSATAQPGAGGLTDNVAGMLAYVTIIPAIIFLVIEPYNKNRFIRFHSFQCIFFCVAIIAISIGLSIFSLIPFIGLILLPVHLLFGLGIFAVWIILMLKANQGQMFKLPVIGDMAEKQANA
ncbi:MAG: zinc-ribbon domain-containing protein [Terriglobales bacterium]